MGDDRSEPGAFDVLAEALSERERAVERHLHEHEVQLAEAVAPGILLEEAIRRGQLPAEPEVEPVPDPPER